MEELRSDWPYAKFCHDPDYIAPLAQKAFVIAARTGDHKQRSKTPLSLHVRGTHFQLKVWEALLKIPHGALVTYGDIAKWIENPKASRAVGTAVGANAISLLIPCHRVILSSGIVHNYRWGAARKNAILAFEAALSAQERGSP